MDSVISFSVYGREPHYIDGAIENIKLAAEIYPGWKVWIYHENTAHIAKMEEIRQLGAKTINMGVSRGHSGMFWRFLPAWDGNVVRVIVRDTDSRLNPREAAAVIAWCRSGKKAHSMHDHEHHRSWPLFGGMWGIVQGVLPHRVLCALRAEFRRRQRRVDDMRFLKKHVLPLVKDSLLRHSSWEMSWPYEPFPPHVPWDGFVGEQIRVKT